jgi:type VI secretion system protein ImpM
LYPFIATAIHPTERVGDYLPVLPIAYEVFFDGLREQAVNAVQNSVEALSCRQFLERALHPALSNADDLQLASNVVSRFAAQVPCERIADLLARNQVGATLHQALLNIAFYMDYLRRFDSRATNQIIALPLPDAVGEQALLASAWLSLFVSLWPSRSASWLSCSHLTVRGGGEGVQLIICVGSVSDSFVSVLLGCPIDPKMQLDLAQEHEAWKSHRMYAEASYALGRVLADPDFRLAALCEFLEDMSRLLETKR